ncbi:MULTISPECIES: DUF2461 domain-containing protein [Flavobacteriaceae]|uniref:DUF2461 domain-containing protein n=2 Tax=Flavobacteriaceae TaxID=49546 RepID=A0A4Y8AWF6_9FLAO|nr:MULTISPECIES: DUF2461 domain-containing protein [Flavobacteriaceae]TEW76352.1 DUF2461 domain-containing protein [Gramella jeungdoensis]GGK52179.1 TIGR02453 family protein [Lutibacter litoralis]
MITIDKSTFIFLKNLKENNNRDWFTENKPQFQIEQKKTKEFYKTLMERLKLHDAIDAFKFFRIYRDVRFSKDKTPYKIHFSGSFSRATNRLRGGYYLHISPEGSFVAGGFWQPNKEDLLRIRKEFEMDTSEIRAIISDKTFVKHFEKLQGESLKTAPRGFDKEHQDIDLIRMKQFIVVRNFSEKEVLAPNFMDEVNASFKAMRPYFDYMSEILTTDLNGVSILD